MIQFNTQFITANGAIQTMLVEAMSLRAAEEQFTRENPNTVLEFIELADDRDIHRLTDVDFDDYDDDDESDDIDEGYDFSPTW